GFPFLHGAPRVRSARAARGARGERTTRCGVGRSAPAAVRAGGCVLRAGDARRPPPTSRPRATAPHRLRRAVVVLQRRGVPRSPPRARPTDAACPRGALG